MSRDREQGRPSGASPQGASGPDRGPLPANASSVLGLIRDDGPAAFDSVLQDVADHSGAAVPLQEVEAASGGPPRPAAPETSGTEPGTDATASAREPRRLRLLWALTVVLIVGVLLYGLWTVDALRRVHADLRALAGRVDTAESAAWETQLNSLRQQLKVLEARLQEQQQRLAALRAARSESWRPLAADLAQLQARVAALEPKTPGGPSAGAGEPAVSSPEGTTQGAPRPSESEGQAGDSPGSAAPTENWAVNLITVAGKARADAYRTRYAAHGLDVRTDVFEKGGRSLYRLYVDGYPDRATALREGARLKEALGLDELWVTRVTGRREPR